ncbi:unnamed protein product [Caenorhabditis angaria]|uniref:Uncharacterized protein n=1 Tax=Caenorhabditis angaria TaxID=860376 RepID=A0A9P1I4I7_9PELO|nr:unnamed protein product [Caenorhabditis angaria]
MSLRFIESVTGVGLLAHAIYQFQFNPSWYVYSPIYGLAAILAFIQLPQNSVWRLLSAVSVISGGALSAFLLWTFLTIDSTPSLDLEEAKNLLPVALGAFLSTFIRISSDETTRPVHYVRNFILTSVLLISAVSLLFSIKYL